MERFARNTAACQRPVGPPRTFTPPCYDRHMRFSGEHRFSAPRAIVFATLFDPAAIKAALPGCDLVRRDGDSYTVELLANVAGLRGSYRGTASVQMVRREASWRLAVRGAGTPGTVEGEATIELHDDGDGTRLVYDGDARASGAIARQGATALSGAGRLLISGFLRGMEKQVALRVP